MPEELARWHRFYWAEAGSDSLRFDRAAILIHDSLIRRPMGTMLLQLDLAGSGSLPLGYPGPGPGMEETERSRLHGLLSGVEPVRARDYPTPEAGPATALDQVGSFGLPIFEYSIMLLDFRQQRLGILPPRIPVPEGLWEPDRSVAVEFDGSRVVLPVSAGEGRWRALLDTGLSPFPLWTTRAVWRQLTGRTGAEPGNRRYRIPHPRGTLEFVEAPARSPIRIGTTDLGRLPVVFLERGPPGAALESWPDPVDAILGPSSFRENHLAILELWRRRFIVLEQH